MLAGLIFPASRWRNPSTEIYQGPLEKVQVENEIFIGIKYCTTSTLPFYRIHLVDKFRLAYLCRRRGVHV